MAVVVMDSEDLAALIRQVVVDTIETHAVKVETELKPFLSRTEFMRLMDIGESKTAELFNRPDFPVTREFGHPRVMTKLLLQWAEENTEWVSKNAGVGWNARKAR
ncbi:DNA-binding protein [Paenibacillus sp. FSL M7-0896]|uniref:DNA-binding protein n=1 Tax=Paenibacillus sp. FSL M7-0896 TaxID=2921610 RepID=UPI0030DD5F48